MAPDKARTGPAAKRTRSSEVVATTATIAVSMVTRAADIAPSNLKPARIRVTSLPVAFASAYAPAGRRRLWAFAYLCPSCRGGHFGRADSEQAVNGRRHRGGCGHAVIVRTARVYRAEQAEAVGQ